MSEKESKYFTTAKRMDEAFLRLLEDKQLPYITVKEICLLAKVNRSTFYLHYRTIDDLLLECVEYLNQQFLDYISIKSDKFISKLSVSPVSELNLITPKYLMPYLSFVKENKRAFLTIVNHSDAFNLQGTYSKLFRVVFDPILERFDVSKQDRKYIMTFYISGLMAIIMKWLQNECQDSIEYISSLFMRCINFNLE